jgi:hypothetical protein
MAPSDSAQLREAGLRKLVLARRWLVAASVTLTGVFTAIAANAFPGKSIKPSSSQPATEASPSTRQQQSTESSETSSGSVTPPEQAPQSSEGQEAAPTEASGQGEQEAPVVSGGS